MVKATWKDMAVFCEVTFGSHVDYEEGFFECPECGEMIYRSDWEDYDYTNCPVCEFNFYS